MFNHLFHLPCFRYIPPDKREENDQSTHKWMVYVRGSRREPSIDHFVKKVWFFLHPSYKPNDLVEVRFVFLCTVRICYGLIQRKNADVFQHKLCFCLDFGLVKGIMVQFCGVVLLIDMFTWFCCISPTSLHYAKGSKKATLDNNTSETDRHSVKQHRAKLSYSLWPFSWKTQLHECLMLPSLGYFKYFVSAPADFEMFS